MSIASEISRLQGVKADILDAISAKGVTVPAGSALDDCPGLIADISGGGSPSFEYGFKYGNLNFNKNGEARGFTSVGDYLVPTVGDNTYPTYDRSKPFELCITFKSNFTSKTGSEALCGCTVTDTYYRQPSIEIAGSSGVSSIWFGYSTDGSSWTQNLNVYSSNFAVRNNTYTTVKYIWTGSIWKVQISDDLNSYENTAYVSTPFYQPSANEPIGLGNCANSSTLMAKSVTFDLYKTYYKENGVLIWGCDS